MQSNVKVTITIACDELTQDMAEYHRQKYDENTARSRRSRITQRESQSYYWQAKVHQEMVEFWQKVQITHPADAKEPQS